MSCLAEELADIDLGDRRLNRRAGQLIETLGERPTLSIPAAGHGWDETRAAYRLFDHQAVTAETVRAPHRAYAAQRGTLGQEKAAHRPLEEKDSVRWVDGFARVNELAETLSETRLTYIADREGDLYDLFVEAPCPEHSADWLAR